MQQEVVLSRSQSDVPAEPTKPFLQWRLAPHKAPTVFPTTFVPYTQCHSLIRIVPRRQTFLFATLLSSSYTFCSALACGFNFAFLHAQKFPPVSHFHRLPISLYFLVRFSFLYSSHIYSSKVFLSLCLSTLFLPSTLLPLGTALPLYRTGISLLSRERFLYI